MKGILKLLNERPIAYYPIYKEITGSTTAGILLSQLMYWLAKKDKIHKTDNEIFRETLLTENELRAAKLKIKKLSFITVTREGIPAKTYYEIDWENYKTSLAELTNTDSLNSQNSDSENNEPIIVKSFDRDYTETTTENKKDIKKGFSFSLKKMCQYENLTPEYQERLKGYAVTKDGACSLEKFLDHHISKGSKFKDWSRAYNTWLNNSRQYNKFNPENYIYLLPKHPIHGELYAEYGTNRAWSKEFKYITEFENKTQQQPSEEMQTQHYGDSKAIVSAAQNLAAKHRV